MMNDSVQMTNGAARNGFSAEMPPGSLKMDTPAVMEAAPRLPKTNGSKAPVTSYADGRSAPSLSSEPQAVADIHPNAYRPAILNNSPQTGVPTQSMLVKVLPYAITMILTFAAAFYIYNYKAEMVRDLILKVDVLGLTPIGQEEQFRQAAINQLDITYEEKQVLLGRTVFLGATPAMVQLALGTPKEQRDIAADADYGAGTLMVYYFSQNSAPTMLRFEGDKMVKAFKGSSLDLR